MAEQGSLLKVRIDTRALQKFSNKIGELAKRLNDYEPFVDDAAAYMVNVTRNRILRSKRGPDGEAWAPLSELTKDLKGSSTILFDSGELARSIFDQKTRRGFEIVAGADYAPYMHYGVRPEKHGGSLLNKEGRRVQPRGGIPARPFMGLSPENVRRITKMLRGHIAGEEEASAYGEGFE
jgi:phage gpG-like protein